MLSGIFVPHMIALIKKNEPNNINNNQLIKSSIMCISNDAKPP